MTEKRYSDEEVQEILRRAVVTRAEGLEHDDLISAAAEIGIEQSALEEAAADVRLDRDAKAIVSKKSARRRRRLLNNTLFVGVTGLFLAGIDYLSGPGWWVQWPLLVGAFLTALHAMRVFSRDAGKDLDAARREIRRAIEKRRRKERRKTKTKAKPDLKKAEQAFESAIEVGLARNARVTGDQDRRCRATARARHRVRSICGEEGKGAGPSGPHRAIRAQSRCW